MTLETRLGEMIGMYNVKGALNSGGMAYVVLVRYQEREFVLKISKNTGDFESDQHNNRAIKKEAYLLASMKHDRIVKVYPLVTNPDAIGTQERKVFSAKATGLSKSPWYFSMEYLSGGTLDDYVTKCGPLTVAESTNIVGNIGLGLAYLHSHLIAHNDVKPENVMFREKIIKGQPYDPVLIDFGTAAGVKRFVDEAGSWFTMSPERVRGATGRDAPELATKLDPLRADIWSLGILLYKSLTTSLPFTSSNHKRLTSQILNDVPASLTHWNKSIPKELDNFVINHCLAKKPEDRPTTKEFLSFVYQFSGRGVPAESIKDGYYGKN